MITGIIKYSCSFAPINEKIEKIRKAAINQIVSILKATLRSISNFFPMKMYRMKNIIGITVTALFIIS